MTSEEELKLAKEQQEKNDQEKLEKELSEAGITPPDDDAPLTMKAMKDLFGFMSGKMVDKVLGSLIIKMPPHQPVPLSLRPWLIRIT